MRWTSRSCPRGFSVLSSKGFLDAVVHRRADANAYYQLTFEAPHSQEPGEYHALKVNISRSSAVVRTTAGYYGEPPAN